jgi:hypothetical protein
MSTATSGDARWDAGDDLGHEGDPGAPGAPPLDAPTLDAAKAEIDRWVAELTAQGAIDEGTTDLFERYVDDWRDRQLAVLDTRRIERERHRDRELVAAEVEHSRRTLLRRRAQLLHAAASRELEAAEALAAEVVRPATELTPDTTLEAPAADAVPQLEIAR